MRETTVGPSIPGEAFAQRRDAMQLAAPLTDEHRTWLDPPRGAERTRLICASFRRSANAFEGSTDVGIEIAVGLRLETVGEDLRQERLCEMRRRIPAEDVAPLQAKTAEIERRQFSNALRDCDCGTRGWPVAWKSRPTQRRGGHLASELRRAGRPAGIEGFDETTWGPNLPSRRPRPRP